MLEIEDQGLVKSRTLTSRVLTEDYPSQLPFTTASAINKAVALAPRLVVELG